MHMVTQAGKIVCRIACSLALPGWSVSALQAAYNCTLASRLVKHMLQRFGEAHFSPCSKWQSEMLGATGSKASQTRSQGAVSIAASAHRLSLSEVAIVGERQYGVKHVLTSACLLACPEVCNCKIAAVSERAGSADSQCSMADVCCVPAV